MKVKQLDRQSRNIATLLLLPGFLTPVYSFGHIQYKNGVKVYEVRIFEIQ